MAEFIESKAGKDGKILVEVKNVGGAVGFGAAKSKEQEAHIDNAFNHALNTIRLAADSVLETLETLDDRKPDHVKIDFAIKIDGQAGAMLARADSGDAQLRVSLGWQHKPESADADEDKDEPILPAKENTEE